jgi:hypothetical protein
MIAGGHALVVAGRLAALNISAREGGRSGRATERESKREAERERRLFVFIATAL